MPSVDVEPLKVRKAVKDWVRDNFVNSSWCTHEKLKPMYNEVRVDEVHSQTSGLVDLYFLIPCYCPDCMEMQEARIDYKLIKRDHYTSHSWPIHGL